MGVKKRNDPAMDDMTTRVYSGTLVIFFYSFGFSEMGFRELVF